MSLQIRSASLTGYADLVRSLGLDPSPLAVEAGLSPTVLGDPDQIVSSLAVGRMLERAAELTGRDDLGVRLAATRRLSNLGAVARIARAQPSLKKALEVLGQHQWLHNQALMLTLESSDEAVVARVDLSTAGHRVSRQAVDLALGVFVGNIRALLGRRWSPQAVLFRHGPPRDWAAHRAHFAAPLRFWEAMDAVVLDPADLAAPLPAPDPRAAAEARRDLERAEAERRRSAADCVGELIVLLLPTGDCSADRVAEHLGVDRRTLHRRLAREGRGYHELRHEKRSEVALSLMAAGRPLTDVAELTGFPALSGFSHWFRRRFEVSPSAYRRGRAARREDAQ